MKNFKRIFSIFSALALSVMCVLPVSATEFDKDSVVESLNSSPSVDDGCKDVDSVSSTRELQALTDVMVVQNITTGQVVTGKFITSIPDYKNITVTMNCEAPCTVSVIGLAGMTESKYIPAGGGTFTIANGKGTFSYSIRFHYNAPAAVYSFFATDNYYG